MHLMTRWSVLAMRSGVLAGCMDSGTSKAMRRQGAEVRASNCPGACAPTPPPLSLTDSRVSLSKLPRVPFSLSLCTQNKDGTPGRRRNVQGSPQQGKRGGWKRTSPAFNPPSRRRGAAHSASLL